MKTFKQFLTEAKILPSQNKSWGFYNELYSIFGGDVNKIKTVWNEMFGLISNITNMDSKQIRALLDSKAGRYLADEFHKDIVDGNLTKAFSKKYDSEKFKKTYKAFLTEAKKSSKYKKGEFGYWWTTILEREDIEGQVYNGNVSCWEGGVTSLKGCPKEVKGDFNCSHNKLTSLEFAPEKVGGDFLCDYNKLTTLEGCPKVVGGYFGCDVNRLTSLKGCPQKVGSGFSCSYNKITSLEGCPKEVKGEFHCDSNKLTSLKGSPQKISGNFRCGGNKLTTLEGCPKEVGDYFLCSYNQLTSLKGCPQKIGGDFGCDNNKLTTLEGCPEVIKGAFDCSKNNLTSLKGAPKKVGKWFDCSKNKLLTSAEGYPEKIGGSVYGVSKLKLPKNASQKIISNTEQYEEILDDMFKSGELEHMDDNNINYLLCRKIIKVIGYDSSYAKLLCTALVDVEQKIIEYICEVLDDEGDEFNDLEKDYYEDIEFKFKDVDDFKKQLTKIRDLIKETQAKIKQNEYTSRKILLSESKQRLHEGAWALPNTSKKAKDLEKLFKSSLTAKIAKDKLYDLFGDDHLFDILDDYIKEGDDDLDVRNVIKDELKIMLNDYAKRPKDFLVKFDDEAIKILRKLVK